MQGNSGAACDSCSGDEVPEHGAGVLEPPGVELHCCLEDAGLLLKRRREKIPTRFSVLSRERDAAAFEVRRHRLTWEEPEFLRVKLGKVDDVREVREGGAFDHGFAAPYLGIAYLGARDAGIGGDIVTRPDLHRLDFTFDSRESSFVAGKHFFACQCDETSAGT